MITLNMSIACKSAFTLVITICIILGNASNVSSKPKPRILVFSKTAGFHHSSIAVGNVAIQKLGAKNKFDVDTTTDASWFTNDKLKQYAAIVFLSTTGNSDKLFTGEQKNALVQYMKNGGGYMGIHAATDCCYDWQWYGDLSGAYFGAHPSQQLAEITITDKKTSATKHLPNPWKRKDEWYNFKWMAPDLHVLVNIDEKSYSPGKAAMGENHPMAWYHKFEGGRAFYTALGHTDESYADPLFLQHILAGIQYAITGKIK